MCRMSMDRGRLIPWRDRHQSYWVQPTFKDTGHDEQSRPLVRDQRAGHGAGALVRAPGVPSGGTGTLVCFGCEDCAVEGSRVASAGGKIHREKMSIGEYGFIVLAVDTQGNMFGLHSLV